MQNWEGAEPAIPSGVAPGEMSEHDLDDVLRIEAASFDSPWTRGHFESVLRSPLAWNPVLRRGDRVVAYACTVGVEDEIEVQDVAVDGGDRGRGFGTFLVRAILAEARRRGCRRVHLEVRPSNRPAVRLYERHGFQRTGHRRGYYDGPPEDAVLMTARLDEESAEHDAKED